MNCPNCGTEALPGASFCTQCGTALPTEVYEATPVNETPNAQGIPYAYGEAAHDVRTEADYVQGVAMSETDSGLRLAAFIINVISTVLFGFLIIPLAWMIPMTVHSWGIYKGTKPNTVAFGVCTLIFVDVISGILLLCSKKDN